MQEPGVFVILQSYQKGDLFEWRFRRYNNFYSLGCRLLIELNDNPSSLAADPTSDTTVGFGWKVLRHSKCVAFELLFISFYKIFLDWWAIQTHSRWVIPQWIIRAFLFFKMQFGFIVQKSVFTFSVCVSPDFDVPASIRSTSTHMIFTLPRFFSSAVTILTRLLSIVST